MPDALCAAMVSSRSLWNVSMSPILAAAVPACAVSLAYSVMVSVSPCKTNDSTRSFSNRSSTSE